MSAKKLSTFSIMFGMLSLIFCWFFWYPVWGIFISLVSIILAIIAIVLGKKSIKFYKQDPLKKDFYRNARIGFNLGIAGLIISLFCFILAILFTVYFKIFV